MDEMARPRKLTPLEEYAAYGLRKSGVSYAEIAHNNGVSVRTIERIIKRIEIDKKPKESGV
jgi:DNA invertase Pin-like site-specific DNA recombinase